MRVCLIFVGNIVALRKLVQADSFACKRRDCQETIATANVQQLGNRTDFMRGVVFAIAPFVVFQTVVTIDRTAENFPTLVVTVCAVAIRNGA